MTHQSFIAFGRQRRVTRAMLVALTTLTAAGLTGATAYAQSPSPSVFDARTAVPSADQASQVQPLRPGTPSPKLALPAPFDGPGAMDELIKPIPGDFARLFTVNNAIVAGAGGAAALVAHQADDNIFNSKWDDKRQGAYAPGQYLGDVMVNMAAGLTVYTAGRYAGKPKLRAMGADIFRSQVVSQALVQTIKPLTSRTRPDASNDHSFPSGHSATAFATATVVQKHLGWKWGVPAYAVASLTATSRLNHQRHYLSDVVFGATLGIVSARAVTVGRNDLKFALAPSVTRDGWRLDFVKLN